MDEDQISSIYYSYVNRYKFQHWKREKFNFEKKYQLDTNNLEHK